MSIRLQVAAMFLNHAISFEAILAFASVSTRPYHDDFQLLTVFQKVRSRARKAYFDVSLPYWFQDVAWLTQSIFCKHQAMSNHRGVALTGRLKRVESYLDDRSRQQRETSWDQYHVKAKGCPCVVSEDNRDVSSSSYHVPCQLRP